MRTALLATKKNDQPFKSGYAVNEVVGLLDMETIRRTLEDECEAKVMKVDASSSYPRALFTKGNADMGCSRIVSPNS
jgi:hypothetical protein